VKNIRKAVLQYIFITGLVAASISGCEVLSRIENGLTQQEITPTPTIAPETPAATTPETTPPAADQPISLVLWVPPQFEPIEGNPAGLMLAARLQEFESAHADLNVEIRVKDLSGSSSLLNSLAAATAAAPEALPGLILLNRADMETAALKGLIFPIPSRAADYNSPDWFPFTEELASTQGVQYGLPLFVDPLVLAYNEQAVAFPASTWQELSAQSIPIAVNLAAPSAVLPYAIYLSAGGNLVDDKGSPILEADALTRTYQIISSGATANVFPAWLASLQSPQDAKSALTNGQTSYALLWASQVLQAELHNIGIAPVPGSASASAGFVDGWMLCITNPTAEHSRFDILLADYLLEPGFLSRWSEAAGYLPVQRSTLENWQDTSLAGTLAAIADQSIVLPSVKLQQSSGIVLNQYTISLIRQQISPMQAVVDSLAALEVK
jgi:ABC-type glycerol-3-phosphate transport system substrate-binding protein